MIERDYNALVKYLDRARCKSAGSICEACARFFSELYVSNVVGSKWHSNTFIEFEVVDNKGTTLDEISALMLQVSSYCTSKLGHKAFVTGFDVLSTENKSKMFVAGYIDNSTDIEQVKVEFKLLVVHKGSLSKTFRDNALSGMTSGNKEYHDNLMQLHTKSDWTKFIATIRSLSKDGVKGVCKKDNVWYVKLNRTETSNPTKKIGAFIASYCHSCRVYGGEGIFMISKNAPTGLIVFILKYSKDWRVRTVCTIKLV